MSEWYTYDEKSKKALLTLMERAKRPIRVTAGKLLDLSLTTFVMVCKPNQKNIYIFSMFVFRSYADPTR